MRAIKFRAWDKIQKKMLLPNEQRFCIVSSGHEMTVRLAEWYGPEVVNQINRAYEERLVDPLRTIDGNIMPGDWAIFDYSDFYAIEALEVMQFTGLFDKNKKEIYEGDIVRWSDCYEPEDSIEVSVHQVVYCAEDDYPAFDLKPYLCEELNGLSYAMAEGYLEVIGNLHEHPHLLESSHE